MYSLLPIALPAMIKNKNALIQNAATPALKKVRKDILTLLEHVCIRIDPHGAMRQAVRLEKKNLIVAGKHFDVSRYKRIYVVGGGKAVFAMAHALEQILGTFITKGHINVVQGKPGVLKRITYTEAGHPVPTAQGVLGTKKMVALLEEAEKDDLVIALISGGGSACMPLPVDGVSLQEKIELTQLFLKSNATIHEINTVRKHLSLWKGGHLAQYASPATVIGLYISDIVGDDFATQASGPVAPDTTTFADAITILKRKNIWDTVSPSIKMHLERGLHDTTLETPKPGNNFFEKVFNVTICNHRTSLLAVAEKARELGYTPLPLTSFLEGEAREVATALMGVAAEVKQHDSPVKKPAVIIASGEIPVHVQGTGSGGRNQEAVLAASLKLAQGITFVSFATDGVDGLTPSPVAGAIADEFTQQRACKKNMDTYAHLANNDSYTFFNTLGDHIITGVTGTNVGDLVLIIIV